MRDISQPTSMTYYHIKNALRIRRVEETFLRLFSEGKLNGTVHTCIGQEFSALAFAGQLQEGDCVVSNHRCHGHFLAFSNDAQGLVAELMGKASGICGGVGSSQHLCRNGFYSNGIQGGTVPVAAGLALARKFDGDNAISVVFMGDGTLGQGAVYEAMNMAAKWELPLLLVCEHNRYAQSTATADTIAGTIPGRAEAFGIPTYHSTTAEPDDLMEAAAQAIEIVRSTGKPVFHLVDTHRLAPHSKGDDAREESELAACRSEDPICRFMTEKPNEYQEMLAEIDTEIQTILNTVSSGDDLSYASYAPMEAVTAAPRWSPIDPSEKRQVDLLHEALARHMADADDMVLLGEDIAAPYGGAFKVTRDLSERFPKRVISTPISEAGISGIANGLALGGYRPVLEIMFGDFITLALDQLINHAAKFRHMYNHQVRCPLIVRTPMGGGRGYGPTHSQSLDKFLAGIDTVTLCALNSLIDPAKIYQHVFAQKDPVVVLEHKLDYGRRIAARSVPGYTFEQTTEGWPTARIRPKSSDPDVTIVAYGGMTDLVVSCLESLFKKHDTKAEVIVPTRLCPLDVGPIVDSVRTTGRMVTVEEGSLFSGIGAEVIAQTMEQAGVPLAVKRIGARPVPIPSQRHLEDRVLPTRDSILHEISEFLS